MHKLKQKILPQLFIINLRYVLGGAFVFASLIKIKGHRFTTLSGEVEPINSAWHFFETMYQSGFYWKFIGICQLLAGLLIMTQRYSKLGAVINLPIVLNIFIITLSYDFNYTPVITGLMLVANIVLIIWDWNELKLLLNLRPIIENKSRMEHNILWQIIGLLLFVFTFTYRILVDKYDLVFWLTGFLAITVFGHVNGLLINKLKSKTK
ncbi:MAG: hypothetical protein Tsb0033_26940 [Winogradskyella sp.]